MAQSKILVDTNAYIRLAQSIKPLLHVPFGADDYCLYVIPELNDELTNQRLANKFQWVCEDEYVESRSFFPSLSKKQKKSIENTYDHVWAFVLSDLPGPSRVDARYIAYALDLDIPVVTDDRDMVELAKTFGAQPMGALQLLKLMLDASHINMVMIDSIIRYWRYIDDSPSGQRRMTIDYRRLFRKEPP